MSGLRPDNWVPERFPYVPPELVQKLATLFPNRCPEPTMSDREIWMAAGAAQVVALLQRHLNDQSPHDAPLIKEPTHVR